MRLRWAWWRTVAPGCMTHQSVRLLRILPRYLVAHGEKELADSRSTKFRSSFPINIRPRGADIDKTLGNQFVLLSLALPLHITDPLERLVEVKRLCDNMKVSPETPLSAALNKTALAVLPMDKYVEVTTTLLGKFSFLVRAYTTCAAQAMLLARPPSVA